MGRSQRHMTEMKDIYDATSAGEVPVRLVTDVTVESSTTTVNEDYSANFTGETTFEIENPPEDCDIDSSSGVVSGTSSAGAYTDVRIWAKNAISSARTSKFTWTVS